MIDIKYFFVPLQYEELLTNFLLAYTQGNDKRTLIEGVYKPSKNVVVVGTSTVFNRTQPLNEEVGIVKYFPYSIKNQNLVGFCVKGNILQAYPEAYENLISLSEVKVFNSSQEFLEYVNDIL